MFDMDKAYTGSMIPNGAVILMKKHNPKGGWIVLCVWHTEFVTWSADKEGDVYWGHYYPGLERALADFHKREV
jgi:hypothetical protein